MKQMKFEKEDFQKAEDSLDGVQKQYEKLKQEHNDLKKHVIQMKADWQDEMFEVKQDHCDQVTAMKSKYQRIITQLQRLSQT